MHPDPLIEAAGLVADGVMPDWGSTSSRLSTDEERSVADELALVAKIANEHRRLHQLLPAPAGSAPATLDRSSWGHLELLEVVGRGSYGTVYRAWDGRLDRQVALKLFHGAKEPEAVMRESRMLARIRHDNVVAVYGADVFDGVAGIWMEFIRGRSVDQIVKEQGPLSAQEATLVGLEMSRALAAVHAAGLLHCDVKAQNVIREPGGRLVLMDLGAARAVPGADDTTHKDHLTGTPRYMAPELFARRPASPQSDLYSLGVLLFYLVTGSYPVDGKTLTEIKKGHAEGRRQHLRDLRPELPTGYLREVTKALEPDPLTRHQSAGQLEAGLLALAPVPVLDHVNAAQPSKVMTTRRIMVVAALALGLAAGFATWRCVEQISTSRVSGVRSIAVLPIRNLTGDPSHDYLAEGLTEVLISNLARVRAFSVPSFGAVAPYRGQPASAAKLSVPLAVELLLAGSIVEVSSRVRIAVSLIDRTDRVVWADELTLVPSQVLGAQAEIARRVAAHLSVDLSPDEREGLRSQPIDPRAQEAFLKGLLEAESGLDSHIPQAAEHFRQVTEIEPTFAPGWAGRSMSELQLAQFADAAVRSRRIRDAKDLAARALSLDAGLPSALVALGTAQFYYDWDFASAERTYRRALEAAPSDGQAKEYLALLLAALGRVDEAVEFGEEAVRVEPLVSMRLTTLGTLYYYQRNYARASEMMEASLKIAPENPLAYFMLGRILAAEGQYDRAAENIQRALARSRNLAWLPELACILAAAGRTAGVENVLKELAERERSGEAYSIDHRAHMAAADGRLDEGIEILRQAIERNVPNVLWMAVDPRLDPFRSDPRFEQLLRQARLHP